MKNTTILVLAFVLLFSSSALAADTRWIGNGEDWSNTDWWVGGLEPTSAHSCQIDGTVVVSHPNEVVGKGFYVGYSSGDDATVRIISGDLTTSDTVQIGFIGRSGKGTLELLDGIFHPTSMTTLGYNPSGEGICKVDGGFFDAESLRIGERGTGTITQTNGILDASGILLGYWDDSHGTYEISGGSLSVPTFKLGPHRFEASFPTFDIQSSAADITFTSDFCFYAPNSVFMAVARSKIKMVGEYPDFINELNTAKQENVSGLGNLTMEFSDNSTGTYCTYEVACEDLGANISGYCGGNFTLNTLAVGAGTASKVRLVDDFDNGNRGVGSECLYVRKLIVTAGSTLDLSGLNIYYQEAEIAGTVDNGTPQNIWILDMNDDGVVAEYELMKIAEYWLDDDCSCPNLCDGADLYIDGFVNFFDFAVLANHWREGGTNKFYEETFNSNPGWSIEGEWAFGIPTGGGGMYGNPDPTSGYTDSNVYGINLSGDYSTTATGTYKYLITPAIDCTGHFDVELRFWRWLNTDEPQYVPASIDISADGSIWHNIWYNLDDTGSLSVPLTDSAWTQKAYDVSDYANNNPTFWVRWGHWVKTGAYEYSGWNIDDVELWGTP